ncbi:hypothetical protein AB0896_27225 [Streptomyces parvulus]|uniref:hypothetical protein n=1 Tax=Streptomyces parvulus TaxID=146923 RepID=UPI0034571192
MSFWTSQLAGTLLGGLIASGTSVGLQVMANWRESRRESRKEAAEDRAAHKARLIDGLRELQEELSGLAAVIDIDATTVSGEFVSTGTEVARHHTRAMIACSRMENAELAGAVRDWLSELHATLEHHRRDLVQPYGPRLHDLQRQIGAELNRLHSS